MLSPELIVEPGLTLREALRLIDANARQILYVTEREKLVGALSDGDIRRWFLNDGSMDAKVSSVMNPHPKWLKISERRQAQDFMTKHSITSVPLLGETGELLDIVFLIHKRTQKHNCSTPVVIMAGGIGSRLAPYTKIIPKPLIPIGDQPIVERIMDRFIDDGFCHFLMSINYKKDMIKAYFMDPTNPYDVRFFEEEIPLGTAGSLALMKDDLKETFFVTNCDILIDTDFSEILKKHRSRKDLITMVLAKRETVIPYGVVELEDGRITSLREKPSYSHYTSTGVYVMEPEILPYVPQGRDVPVTELLLEAMQQGRLGYALIDEDSWLDMGQMTEMEVMIEKLGVK